MKKEFLFAWLMGMAVSPSFAQAPVISGATMPCAGTTQLCFKPPIAGAPLGFQQIIAPVASTGFTIPAGAQEALIICESQSIRWRDDGVAPTAGVGMLLPINTPFAYTGSLTAFRMIETNADSTCDVSYYR